MENIANKERIATLARPVSVDLPAGNIQDEEYAFSKVSGNYKTFWQMLVVMVGFTYFSPSMMAGGQLGIGLNFSNFVLAIILLSLIHI